MLVSFLIHLHSKLKFSIICKIFLIYLQSHTRCVAEAAPGEVIVVMSSRHFEGLPVRISEALEERA
jgi:hypothetical protein